MTALYLVFSSSLLEACARGLEDPVYMLVSYPLLKEWERHRHRVPNLRQWALDSGGFMVQTKGIHIDNEAFITDALQCDAADIFGLDIPGKPDVTRANLERAWERGLPAIPTFHYGSPASALEWACATAEKIALGGMAKIHEKHRAHWVKQCFARIWPKKIHTLGMVSSTLLTVPAHSADSSGYLNIQRFGSSTYLHKLAHGVANARPGRTYCNVSTKIASHDIRAEIEIVQDFARKLRFRWREQLARLDDPEFRARWKGTPWEGRSECARSSEAEAEPEAGEATSKSTPTASGRSRRK